jgi:hypothetical protein
MSGILEKPRGDCQFSVQAKSAFLNNTTPVAARLAGDSGLEGDPRASPAATGFAAWFVHKHDNAPVAARLAGGAVYQSTFQ